MSPTKMFVLTETSEFMMSYVILTRAGNCIIVDGGRPEDIPLLREKVKGHPIKAWFLTHPHLDHITAFHEIVRTDDPDFQIEAVYYNFPSVEYAKSDDTDHPTATLEEFLSLLPKIADRAHIVHTGDILPVDEIRIEILYHFEEAYPFSYRSLNNASIAFRLDTEHTSVMFLGDLGPEGGDKLMELSMDKLKADYCQMAHHGHSGVSSDVYLQIDPKVCIWNAPAWLWEEPPTRFGDRIYGQKMTRYWMEKLGVTQHIITKDGTAEIDL